MDNRKTPWSDVSFIWKKIAGVIAAVGILATFMVKVFKTPADWTYTIFAALGFIFLMISWYVDKQTLYIYKEMEDRKKEIDKNLEAHKEDAGQLVQNMYDNIDKLMTISEDTRKDTLRIQLLLMIQTQPENVDTILKIAETYFVQLKGDWYMTNEFNKWAKSHDVIIPTNIHDQMILHLEDK